MNDVYIIHRDLKVANILLHFPSQIDNLDLNN